MSKSRLPNLLLHYALIGLALACSESPTEREESVVTLRVAAARYEPGDTIRVTFANGTSFAIGVGNPACDVALQVQRNGEWAGVNRLYPPGSEPVACDAALHGLAPGDSWVIDQPVQPWMEPGQYRFVTSFVWRYSDVDERTFRLTSNRFTIAGVSLASE
jgi:hypothetical protein